MVGKLQDIVTAAVIVGATERSGNLKNLSKNSQLVNNAESQQVQPVKVNESENRFVVDTQNIGNEDEENIFQKDEQDEENFHLEPGSVDEETVDLMTQELNDLMSKINCNLQFDYHKDADVMSVLMIDKETQDVIKEMPPEEMVENMVKAKIWIGALIGAFIDKKI